MIELNDRNYVESDPAVVAYNGVLHVYVAVQLYHSDGFFYDDLWDHYWNGGWNWDDHGSV
jgi:hypothetical protein